MRKPGWDGTTRSQKLVAIAYPTLTNEETRREMAALSANERKRPPAASPLIADNKRGAVSPLGGLAKVQQRRNAR
jgi:hypothetical protein